MDWDECPVCGRWISDHDPAGCVAPWGQRYCVRHLPEEDAPGLYLYPSDVEWLRQVRDEYGVL